MDGYRLVFSTIRGRKHDNLQVHEWLIAKAKEIGIEGVTVIAALEGYGKNKTLHSADYFELVDEPLEVIILTDEKKCDLLFRIIKEDNLNIFYSKSKAEFGFTL
ncbi:MAG: DUF190 domain-containing protein [Thiovulaceae bacterium]|nr:DUF190 domain-containing protein [Sulfurimonadaceae bacterium]